ncbi:isatin hydrolase [Rhipicephalus microplus]|uniref:isatin hydrolase n=1 Tax=Rhipicephalus microplus TaxID=6941 RepID=UPI003F6B89ED
MPELTTQAVNSVGSKMTVMSWVRHWGSCLLCLVCVTLCIYCVVRVTSYQDDAATECDWPSMARNAITLDLTYNFTNETIYWQTGATFQLDVEAYPGPGDEWKQIDQISEKTHGGTHLDAPLHCAKGGWSVADIPIERLMYVPIVKLDIRSKVQADPEYIITLSDIHDWETRYGRVPDGCLFLVDTGRCRLWPNRTAYMGLDEKGDRHYPSLAPEAATFLTSERRPYGFGLDGPSLDHYPELTVHNIIAAASLYTTENLACLSRVPAVGATGFVLPMKIPGASGAPVRVVATLP